MEQTDTGSLMSREPTDSDKTRNIEPLRPGVDSFDFIDEEIDGADSSAFDAFMSRESDDEPSAGFETNENTSGQDNGEPASVDAWDRPPERPTRQRASRSVGHVSERFAALVAGEIGPPSPPQRQPRSGSQRFEALFSEPPPVPTAPLGQRRARRQSGDSEVVSKRSKGFVPPPAPARPPSEGMEPLSVRSRRTGSFRLDAAPSEGIQRVVGSPVSEHDPYSGEVIQLSARDVVRAKSTSMSTLSSTEVPEKEEEKGVVNAIGQSAATVRRRLARRFKIMAPGDVATIICDDPDIPVGIQDWSLTMGFDVDSLFTDELGNWTVHVRRKGAIERDVSAGRQVSQDLPTARSTPRDGFSAAEFLAPDASPDRPLESDGPRRAVESSVPYTVFARSADELRQSLRAAPHSAAKFSVRASGDSASNVLMRWCLEQGHRLIHFERTDSQFVASVVRVPDES